LAARNDSLPPPVSDKIYTFQQIEQQKFDLNGKIVRIEIGSLFGDGKSHLPNGALYVQGRNAFWPGGVSIGRIAQRRVAG
jgi:hypothetical protein